MGMTGQVDVTLAAALLVALAWLAVLLRLAPRRKRQKPAAATSYAEDEAKSGQDPDAIFILVHGTFGWNASWLREGSLLRRALRTSTAGASLVQQIRWSGFNSFSGRSDAARRIQDQVAGNGARWPRARQFVVAHSHGGTAALQAMRDPNCSGATTGVICMATPFLVATRLRTVARSGWIADAVMNIRIYLTGTVLVWLLSLVVPDCIWEPTANGAHKLWLAVLPPFTLEFRIENLLWSFGLFLAIGGWFLALNWFLRQWTAKYELQIEGALAFPTLASSRLLIVRQPGDEAGGAIGGVQAVNWLLGLMTRMVVAATAFFDGAVRRARRSHLRAFWILAVIAFVIAYGAASFGSGPSGEFRVLLNAIDAVFFTVSVFVVAAFLLAAPIGVAGAILFLLHTVSVTLSALATGPEMLLAGERLRVTAEPTPPGMWQVTSVPIYSDTYRGRIMVGDLWHSYLYENPRTIALISQWVTEQREEKADAAQCRPADSRAAPVRT